MAIRTTSSYNFIFDIHNIEWSKTNLSPLVDINPSIHNEFITIIYKILKGVPINWNTPLAKEVAKLTIGDFDWKWKIVDIGRLTTLADIRVFQPKRI